MIYINFFIFYIRSKVFFLILPSIHFVINPTLPNQIEEYQLHLHKYRPSTKFQVPQRRIEKTN